MNNMTGKLIKVFQNDTDGAKAAYPKYRAENKGYSSVSAIVWLDVVRPQLKANGISEDKLMTIESEAEWKIVDAELNKTM